MIFTMRLPDVGEGVAEAELVDWLVAVGDAVLADTPIAEVLTDKATVEITAPVAGTVAALHGRPGDVLAVGGDFVEIDTGTDAPRTDRPQAETPRAETPPAESPRAERPRTDAPQAGARAVPRQEGKVLAAPAVRARAEQLGIDLATVVGSGPEGRVVHADLDRLSPAAAGSPTRRAAPEGGTVREVRGVRRRIAERLSASWAAIPHITYVEAVDVTELERLRAELNRRADQHGGVRLTLLPFLATAIAVAVHDHPGVNAHYDAANQTLTTFDAVHLGVATQTGDGLRVPVVRHVESLDPWQLAAEIARVADAARDGSATRDELTGSTISITSLGALGGLVTTPLINPPEVAIVGINKIEIRPVWQDGAFVPRQMMNLSSSFDHRMVDGWDAAVFVQQLKTLLETPALLFLDIPGRH